MITPPPPTRPPTRLLNNHKPVGPENTTFSGCDVIPFSWYVFLSGFSVASLFWGVCFHLWGG